jgi:sulfite reductase (ferredoxin)
MRRRSGQSGGVHLAASERELFEAQLLLDAGHGQPAVKAAYASMVRAARGLVQAQNPAIGENEEQIIAEFTKRYYDTQLFWDNTPAASFAEYLFKAKEFVSDGKAADADRAVQLLQEAQLFIDAAHDCHNKLGAAVPSAVQIPAAAHSVA